MKKKIGWTILVVILGLPLIGSLEVIVREFFVNPIFLLIIPVGLVFALWLKGILFALEKMEKSFNQGRPKLPQPIPGPPQMPKKEDSK